MLYDPVDNPERQVFPVAGVRAIDRAAIDAGIPGYELMTRAAQFALDIASRAYPDASRWQVLCGGGNNGGDGYLLARLAACRGLAVSVLSLSSPEELTGDASKARQDAESAGVPISPFHGELDSRAELQVDAMLGSGLARDLGGSYADAVAALERANAPVLALDLPSGIDGDNGRIMGKAVRADITATFVGHKPGLYFGAGPDHCGRVAYSRLGIGDEHYRDIAAVCRLTSAGDTAKYLPRRRRQAHKGAFGHVLIVGGGPGMPGAVALAAEAALRSGAGRVSVATCPEHVAVVTSRCPEVMCHGIRDDGALETLAASASVIALGPGLGRTDWSQAVFAATRKRASPMVMDADALNLLAADPDTRDDRILTPHPGEAARLLGGTAAEVQADRPAALAQLTARYGGTVVLKGCGTLVSGREQPWLCIAGNPGMASAGMGDVLTGLVAGLLAQGVDREMAAVLAVDAHARAGDVAAKGGERGLLATDLLREIRPWLNG